MIATYTPTAAVLAIAGCLSAAFCIIWALCSIAGAMSNHESCEEENHE